VVQAEDGSIRGLGEQKFLTGFTKLKRWFHGDFVVVLLWFPWLNFCMRLKYGCFSAVLRILIRDVEKCGTGSAKKSGINFSGYIYESLVTMF
jgi:hypothetical protein